MVKDIKEQYWDPFLRAQIHLKGPFSHDIITSKGPTPEYNYLRD